MGQWAGQPFKLFPWQRDDVIVPLFGTLRPDGMRQYRTAYIEVPKKNGKSHLAAAVALYMLCADSEKGAEVYGAGYDRDQAQIVFRIAMQMVKASEDLSDILEIQESRSKIVDREMGSFYQAISRETLGAHGYNPHAIIFDELHTQRTRELYDTLTMGMAARRQPLIFGITTAGVGTQSLCRQLHNYSEAVLKGTVKDPTWFAYIRAADQKADWTSPKVWRAANPSIGDTVSEDYLRSECNKAKRMPAFENAFRRFHLNQWVQQEERWMPLHEWDACSGRVDPVALEGRECYAGLDLANTTDLNSLALVFPPIAEDEPYKVLIFFWCPADRILERAQRDMVPYDAWSRDGVIETTGGNCTDFRVIRHRIEDLGTRYRIREIAFDRWGAVAMVNELTDAGFEMVQFGQGFASMSAPTKELMRLVLARGIHHGGHPILRWNADNVVVRMDPAGNLKPDKEKSVEKIDGIVALIMALDRALRHLGPSVYEERGLLTV
jgi:phage terminase large subunit-like protein